MNHVEAGMTTLRALTGRLLSHLAARLLPWSHTSQHSAWRAGYVAGALDTAARQQRQEAGR
jgi:hypothetical protein